MIRRRAAFGLFAASALFLTGCAQPARAPAQGEQTLGVWRGRLALQVENEPSQSFSAGFELRGRPDAGELMLYNPLGGTIAALNWGPGTATLRSGGNAWNYQSIDALAVAATGTAIPVSSLFDWLAGNHALVPGWEADLSQLGQGRLHARRVAPTPVADLRIALDK